MALKDNDFSDDYFSDTRMSFGDHLEELRAHLWRAIYGFLVALLLSFFIGKPVLQFIAAPVEEQLQKFYARRVQEIKNELDEHKASLESINQPTEVRLTLPREALLRQILPAELAARVPVQDGEKVVLEAQIAEPLRLAINLHPALQAIGRRPALSTLSIQEAFMAYFKVCIACGVVIGSPWIFWQVWMFVAAGLYPHEKKLVHFYLPFSLGLFIAGIFVCEFFVIPKAIEALLWFNEWIGLEPDLRFNEWLGFAIMMPLVFGISFQTPLVMLFMEKLGVMSPEDFRRKRRMAWFLMAIFAALITPSVDAMSMLFLWVPMGFLYELGIGLAVYSQRNRPAWEKELSDSEEMVEV